MEDRSREGGGSGGGVNCSRGSSCERSVHQDYVSFSESQVGLVHIYQLGGVREKITSHLLKRSKYVVH
jgi:hypothetical protein